MVFMKLSMNIMLLEATPLLSSFLISFSNTNMAVGQNFEVGMTLAPFNVVLKYYVATDHHKVCDFY
jgi:hypothetical protein